MNTGLGDAINLAWKLKAVLAGQASEALLDTYEIERRAFARKLVATTDKAFTFATAEGSRCGFCPHPSRADHRADAVQIRSCTRLHVQRGIPDRHCLS